MYEHRLKVTESIKFLGVHFDSYLCVQQHIEHIERASLISRMRITKLDSTNVTLLIHIYKTFTKPYMDYACTALTALNKKDRDKN